MSKLNNKDLWDECCSAFNTALTKANQQRPYPYRWEKINQAKEQIKEMIRIEFLPNTSWEKSQITMKEAKTMIASLSNEIVKLGKKKPEVTEEWIWKAIDYIKEYPTYHRLEEKLKEAGIEIIKK